MKRISSAIFTALITGVVIISSYCHSAETDATEPRFPDEAEILCRLKKYPGKNCFPPAADRKSWQEIPEATRRELIANAEGKLKSPWPLMTAGDYMKYRREGNRLAYEVPFFNKRAKLIELVVGECCEYSGRFMDEIIEGIWQLLSEPTWCLPAHEAIPRTEVLPDPTRFRIDLFSSSTGKILTDILQLLEPELAKRSPALVLRVKMEVMRRVVEPAEKLDDVSSWWFAGRNNWTPWCSSNITGCAIYLLDDQPERLAKILTKYLTIIRRFRDKYPDDGGCNEGPSYWRHAVGKYVQNITILDNRLQLEGRLFKDEKLRRMCEYPAGVNLCGNIFLNVSDSIKEIHYAPGFLNFINSKINIPQLSTIAANMRRKKPGRASELNNYLIDVLYEHIADHRSVPFAAVNFWKDLGIAILRENPAAPHRGTIASLKGGHNGESHNHNDLGHFTLLRNGKVLVADVGVGIYVAQTFSSTRFDIWNLGALGHNQPRFSGLMQEKGQEYTAALTMDGDSIVNADLDKAYPEKVGVIALKRQLHLDRRTGNVKITDTARVAGAKKVEITLYTAVKPGSFTADKVKWPSGTLHLKDIKVVQIAEETRLDAKLKKSWKHLWRIDLAAEIKDSGSWEMFFDFGKKAK